MATNPMQRKARMSFMLGVLVAVLLCGIIIVILFMQLSNYQQKEKSDKDRQKAVYVLNQPVNAGQEIATNMYSLKTIDSSIVPSNAITDIKILQDYSLQDKEGNDVLRVDGQLYIGHKNGDKVIFTNTEGKTEIKDTKSAKKEEIEKGRKVALLSKVEETGEYYTEIDGNKEFVELNNVPLTAKVPMKANTVITKDMVNKGKVTNDTRKEEYNSFVLPADLSTGDYIDVRLLLPTGENYIVAAKKEVEVPKISGVDSTDTIWLNVTEDEILVISSAIIDAYRTEGAKLYVDKYTDAGIQESAKATYVTSNDINELIKSDPNILDKAKKTLNERQETDTGASTREKILKAREATEEPEEALKTKMQESMQKSQDTRKQYLDSLTGAIK